MGQKGHSSQRNSRCRDPRGVGERAWCGAGTVKGPVAAAQESGGRAGSRRWERRQSARCPDRVEGQSSSPSPGALTRCIGAGTETQRGCGLWEERRQWAGASELRNWGHSRQEDEDRVRPLRSGQTGEGIQVEGLGPGSQ